MTYVKLMSELVIPVIIFVFLLTGIKKRVNVYEEFAGGIRESLLTAFNIFPSIAGIMTAIGMMRASGLMDFITTLISPLTDFFHLPSDIIPIAILRPLSGSGGIAMLTDIINKSGPDSLSGIIASVICGATETTFYTVAVYFGAIGIKNTRHTIKCALIADFVSIITAICVCVILY